MSQEILEKVEASNCQKSVPEFDIGDTVDVHTRILEGDKERIQIYDADITFSNKENSPGIIIDDKFTITCGKKGLLHPKLLQRSGRKKLDISSFLRGFNFTINTKIE